MGSIPVWEDPVCWGATKSMHHSCWACVPEPGNCNYWSPQALEPWSIRRKATAVRSSSTTTRELSPLMATREKPARSNEDAVQPPKKIIIKKIFKKILREMLTTTALLDRHHLLSGTCPASFLVPVPSMSPCIPFSSLKLEGCCFSVTKLLVHLPFLKPISGFPITLKINTGLSRRPSMIWPLLTYLTLLFEFLSLESPSICGKGWAGSPHRVLGSPFSRLSSTPGSCLPL